MQRPRPDDEQRHAERAERLRRETRRRARQRVLIPVVLLAVAALTTAFALRPASTPPAAVPVGSGIAAQAVPAGSLDASASAETSGSVEQTATPSTDATSPAKEATVVPAVVAPKPLRPAPGVKTIVVDKSEQRVTLYTAKGAPVDTFRCASGIVYPRIGTYHVYGHRKQSWSMYDASTFYYFTMFVKSDKGNNIGFHSIPTIDGKLVGKLGVPVSHGCVRLDKAKAKFVYSWATVGTKVVVKR